MQDHNKKRKLRLSLNEKKGNIDKSRKIARGRGGCVATKLLDNNWHNALSNLVTKMAAQSPQCDSDSASSDYSLFMSENGHISFENPNYQLDPRRMAAIDPAKLDDHLNSNFYPSIPVSMFEELKEELDKFESSSNDGSSIGESSSKANRKVYAAMDINSMGVDVCQGPKTTLDNKIVEEKMQESYGTMDRLIQENAPEELSQDADIESDKLRESGKEKADKSDGETDEQEEEEQHKEAAVASEGKRGQSGAASFSSSLLSSSPQQAVVLRRQKKKSQPQQQQSVSVSGSNERSSSNAVGDSKVVEGLPPGWEKHEDDDGPYFWHVKSGTIQREPPVRNSKKHEEEERSAVVRDVRSSRIFEEDFDPLAGAAAAVAAVSPSTGDGRGGNNSRNMRNPHVSMSKSCTSNSIGDIGKENIINNGDTSYSKDRKGGGGSNWKRRSVPTEGGKSGSCDEDQLGNHKAMQVRIKSQISQSNLSTHFSTEKEV